MTYRQLLGASAALDGLAAPDAEARAGLFLTLTVMYDWSPATAWSLALDDPLDDSLRAATVAPEAIARQIGVRALRAAQEVV